MNDEKKQNSIIEKNQKIVNAVLVTEMMKHKGFGIFMEHLKKQEKMIRYQDILGIKDEALSDQKGLALGILEIMGYFKTMEKRAEQPRLNIETSEPEFVKK